MADNYNKKQYYFTKFPLYSNEIPTFRKLPSQIWTPYGKNNDYPDYLEYLYNSSPIHSSVIDGKTTYIFGKGFKIKSSWQGDREALKMILANINASQTFDEVEKDVIKDRTLYGGKAYLIEWGTNGKPISIKRQKFNTIRTNEDKTEFYVSQNWTIDMSKSTKWKKPVNKLPDDTITYPAFDPNKKKGKQILYIIDENPASDIYPLPEYQSGCTPIETDVEVNFFHLNNVKTGFAAGTMLTLFNGTPESEEAQNEIEDSFKEKAAGTDNAGELLINFQNPGDTPPVITPLRSNELDKQYAQLSKDTVDKILYAHRVSNGMLFGIKTEGQLGGRSEFDLAWQHFANTYVEPKQEAENSDANFILSLYGFTGDPLELVKLKPIGIELTTQDILSVLTPEEKRKYILEIMGMESIAEQVVENNLPNNNPVQMNNQDMMLKKLLNAGESADNFDIVDNMYKYDEKESFAVASPSEMISYLNDHRNALISDIASDMNMTREEVYKALDAISRQNTLSITYEDSNNGVKVNTEPTNNENVKTAQLETRWRYTTNSEPKVLPTTREFCKDLIDANRLYTRAEIDAMDNEMTSFNQSVWKYRGGWQTIKGTNQHIPSCRHFWESVVVRRK